MAAFDAVCEASGPAECSAAAEELCRVVDSQLGAGGGGGGPSMPPPQAHSALAFASVAARRVLPSVAARSVLPLISKLGRHPDLNVRQVGVAC